MLTVDKKSFVLFKVLNFVVLKNKRKFVPVRKADNQRGTHPAYVNLPAHRASGGFFCPYFLVS